MKGYLVHILLLVSCIAFGLYGYYKKQQCNNLKATNNYIITKNKIDIDKLHGLMEFQSKTVNWHKHFKSTIVPDRIICCYVPKSACFGCLNKIIQYLNILKDTIGGGKMIIMSETSDLNITTNIPVANQSISLPKSLTEQIILFVCDSKGTVICPYAVNKNTLLYERYFNHHLVELIK